MWTPSDRRLSLRAAAMLLFLGLGLAWTPAAQAAPQNAPAASGEELRDALASRYEALPIRNGVVLKPRQERLGVRTIEVTNDTIAVNGERVTPGVLRAWIGEEAEAILRLQALSNSDRRALLGLEGAGAAIPPVPPLPPPVPEPGDEEEVVEEVPQLSETSETSETPEVIEVPADETPEEGSTADDHGARSTGSRVNFGGSVTVKKGERVEDVVAVGGPVVIDGEVEGDVASVGSSVHVNGKVGGEVSAVGGHVYLGPNSEVDGDVASVGGTIHRQPGAKIGGNASEVGMVPFLRGGHWKDRGDWDFSPWSFWGSSMEVAANLFGLIVLALFVCLTILVAREPLERVDRQLVAQPWMCCVAGLLALLLFVPLVVVVTVLLAITIVGCALFLLYPFIAIALVLYALLGYTAVAHRVGRWIEGRFGRMQGNVYGAALLGLAAIEVWTLLGHVFGMGGGPLGFFSVMFLLFGWAVTSAAWIFGIGAVILARFGTAPGHWPNDRRAGGVPPVPSSPFVPPTPQPVDHLPLSESYGPPADQP